MKFRDTIFALASAGGKAGIAIVRVSGSFSLRTLKSLSAETITDVKTTGIKYLKIWDPENTDVLLDQCVALYFQSPHSFTGEDVVEFQLHGSKAIVTSVLEALHGMKFLRQAEPGEFSRRAFFHNKIDLTKAEGLAMLLDADTSIEKDVALKQFTGSLETLYGTWRKMLLDSISALEAIIDFPDDDIPEEILDAVDYQIRILTERMEEHLYASEKAQKIFEGIKVAIVGPPNAGKSSLLNLLANDEIAIVSEEAGTTRDVVNVKIQVGGYGFILQDTAGIREESAEENICGVEKEGIRRAKITLENADIILYVFDVNNIDLSVIERHHERTFIILNKIDKLEDEDDIDIIKSQLLKVIPNALPLPMSVKYKENIDMLLEEFSDMIEDYYFIDSDQAIATKLRHNDLLDETIYALNLFDIAESLEISIENLRAAAMYLGKMTGEFNTEEVLDNIFSRFCIGK